MVEKIDKCPLIGVIEGPRKLSVIRSRGVSAIQGLLRLGPTMFYIF